MDTRNPRTAMFSCGLTLFVVLALLFLGCGKATTGGKPKKKGSTKAKKDEQRASDSKKAPEKKKARIKKLVSFNYDTWVQECTLIDPTCRNIAYAQSMGSSFLLMKNMGELIRVHELKKMPPTWSQDGTSVAFVAKKGEEWCVFRNDEKGEGFARVYETTVTFSPDGKRLAYAGQRPNGMFVVIDGKLNGPYGSVGYIVFSPDSKHVAFSITKERVARYIVDGKEVGAWANLGKGVFSPDGSRFVYTAVSTKGWHVAERHKKSEPYEEVRNITMSPDGKRLAYGAKKGGKWFAVVDGKESPLKWDGMLVGTPLFSPDSKKIVIGGRTGSKWEMIVDGKKMGEPVDSFLAGSPLWSRTGKHIAWAALKGRQCFVALDGKAGATHQNVGYFAFSHDEGELSYISVDDDKCRVITNGKASEEYDEAILTTYSPFHPRKLAYAAAKGKKWFIVCDGMKGPTYFGIAPEKMGGRIVFDSKKTLHYIAAADEYYEELVLVEQDIE